MDNDPGTGVRPLVAVDLFSGAGGLTAGFELAGLQVIGGMDAWDVAVRSYRLNFSHSVLEADIRQISPIEFLSRVGHAGASVDVVAGGPPCQGFSVQRIGADSDERNELIFEFARYVLHLRPKLFVMENVPGLLGKRGSSTVSRFETMLTESGYVVRQKLVNAADYGVPQIRKRVFFFGWPQGDNSFHFPVGYRSWDSYRTVGEAIGDLPSPPEDHSPDPSDALHRRTRLSPLNLERLRMIPQGAGFESLPPEMRVECHKEGADRIGHRYVYGRLAADQPAATLTARFDSFTRGKFAHPLEDRNITLREGARLQTFADGFQFAGTQEEIAALIGNAVPPLLATVIGKAIVDHLSRVPLTAVQEGTRQLELLAATP